MLPWCIFSLDPLDDSHTSPHSPDLPTFLPVWFSVRELASSFAVKTEATARALSSSPHSSFSGQTPFPSPPASPSLPPPRSFFSWPESILRWLTPCLLTRPFPSQLDVLHHDPNIPFFFHLKILLVTSFSPLPYTALPLCRNLLGRAVCIRGLQFLPHFFLSFTLSPDCSWR